MRGVPQFNYIVLVPSDDKTICRYDVKILVVRFSQPCNVPGLLSDL